MEAETIDGAEFREGQRNQWKKAAGGWHRWSERMTETTQNVSDRLVEMAGVRPGSRVLDVAAGLGEPALTAARAAGADGSVVATDISAEMLAYGRERATAAGISNIEFVESPAAALDFAEGSFDAAVSRWGIIFEPEAEATAQRIRRFLKPGARFAIASWGTPPEAPMLSLPMRTVLGHLEQPPPPPGTPGPLSRPTPEAIAAILEGGGFSDIQVEDTQVVMTWQSPEEFTTFIQDIVAPLVALLEPHPPEVREAAWNAVTEAAREHAADDGTVTLSNKVLLASGSA
jgi:SAM-dependent methyltransferase